MAGERARDSSSSVVTLLGNSASTNVLRATIELVAPGDAKILITGESGSGKEVVARCIHARSRRCDRPLVTVNCAAITDSLLESELFGHTRGSFTGAFRDKVGLLQLAHQGTVFLDEVGEMSLRMQVLLLRFLEDGEIQPVGSDTATRRVDVRVIAATNRSLDEMVRSGQFRADLLYRLDVVHIQVPPLRERRDDIRVLLAHQLERINRRIKFSDATLTILERYSWPGNVRELQNVVEQVAWTATSDIVEPRALPSHIRAEEPAPAGPRRERRRQVSDELFDALASGRYEFWNDVRSMFLRRDITRSDLRQLILRGLEHTHGNYQAMLRLFRLPQQQYKPLLNFLSAHDCQVDFRQIRERDLASRPDAPGCGKGAA